MKPAVRKVRRTLLAVGEGDAEVAFLKHLRSLYCSGGHGVNVVVSNAHGKGPENVINHAKRKGMTAQYDQRVALLDTDIPWTDGLKKHARKAAVEMIGSIPCLEGLLLIILRHQAPQSSAQCKQALQNILTIDLISWESYGKAFPKQLIDSARQRIDELDRLIRFFEGEWTNLR